MTLKNSSKSECGGRKTSNDNNPDCSLEDDVEATPSVGENSYTSLRYRKMALRRKRSLSVADLPVQKQPASFTSTNTQTGFTGYKPVETGYEVVADRRVLRHTETQTRRVGGFTAEESGYDSDATRKSSPRSSLKNDAVMTASGGKVNNNSSSNNNVGSSDDCDSRYVLKSRCFENSDDLLHDGMDDTGTRQHSPALYDCHLHWRRRCTFVYSCTYLHILFNNCS